MSQSIVFYDLANTTQEPWSYNCWKARLALNYKGVEYTTVLIEFPDIQKVMAEVGATPSGQNTDGTPRYTVPTIHDRNHDTFVTDSLEIAKYLDKLHPESVLVPPGSEDLFKQLVLRKSLPVMFGAEFWVISITGICAKLGPRTGPAYEKGYLKALGGPPFSERDPPTDKEWQAVEGGLDRVSKHIASLGGEDPHVFGSSITFGDFIVVSYLLALKEGVDQQRFEALLGANGGRLLRLFNLLQPYMIFEKGEYHGSSHV